MTAIAPTSHMRRAFACWPSRLGVAGLVILALSLGSEVLANARESAGLAVATAAAEP